MAPNIKAEPSEAITVMLPAEIVAKSKNGGLGVLLPPSIDPAVAAAVRSVDYAVLASISGGQAAQINVPFPIEVKFDFPRHGKAQKECVQVCGSSTIIELAHAIDCELNVDAHQRHLVVMGKTLYNHGVEDGDVNALVSLNKAGITAHHVVWVKFSSSSVDVRRIL